MDDVLSKGHLSSSTLFLISLPPLFNILNFLNQVSFFFFFSSGMKKFQTTSHLYLA